MYEVNCVPSQKSHRCAARRLYWSLRLGVDAFAAAYGKDDEINLYCRSGNRAGKAKSALERAGYTNVENKGSLAEAREARSL